MLRRFFVAFTAVFAGALGIEVLNYHALATVAKDRWAMAPQLSETLFLCAALAVLASPTRATIRFLSVMSGVSIAIGLIGLGFHFRSHGLPADFATATSWLGEPPPLAPIEFTVVGLLGLLAAGWRRGGSLISTSETPFAAAAYWIGSLVGLAAFVLAAVGLPASAFIAVFIALGLGALGYIAELSARAVDVASGAT